MTSANDRPDVLFVMTDQQRFDTIAALNYERLRGTARSTDLNCGLNDEHIYTPNLDRLVRRGVAFTNAYSTCPVCAAARYTVRTGCEPPTTRVFHNGHSKPVQGQPANMEERCGAYLPRVMKGLGYRTFGVGKFHAHPWDEQLGYDVHLHSEELYGSPEQRARDGFAGWIAREHPEYDFIETLMGERTEMYYMPQMSPLPAEATVERWAADRAVEQIEVTDKRPYFGFVSFVGPHPPFAPPVPFNRMYDPDRMPDPVRGSIEVDHMDEQIVNMNRAIWADDISDARSRSLKARYYGEITYIDDCLGRILDAVEGRGRAGNTLVCFFTDHGEHLGDHHAWQKESFFEASCRVPFLVSWPARLPAGEKRDELVCLTDLFGIATSAAGGREMREGVGLLGAIEGEAEPREVLVGYYGEPGTPRYKIMVRERGWKYIFMANGGREQLFDLLGDPNESRNLVADRPDVARRLREAAARACAVPGAADALAGDGRQGSDLRVFPFEERGPARIYQFDRSRGVRGFPEKPEDALKGFRRK